MSSRPTEMKLWFPRSRPCYKLLRGGLRVGRVEPFERRVRPFCRSDGKRPIRVQLHSWFGFNVDLQVLGSGKPYLTGFYPVRYCFNGMVSIGGRFPACYCLSCGNASVLVEKNVNVKLNWLSLAVQTNKNPLHPPTINTSGHKK